MDGEKEWWITKLHEVIWSGEWRISEGVEGSKAIVGQNTKGDWKAYYAWGNQL